MCLYPRLIRNPKYKANKKNGGIVPVPTDPRVTAVPVGCGKCIECMKQRSNQWKTRLLEDIKTNKNGKFITFTFDEEALANIDRTLSDKLKGYDRDNAIATKAVRQFLERWRKRYGHSLRHWLVTELGQDNTERIHVHGIIWTNEEKSTVERVWALGHMGWKTTWKQENNRVNEETIGYLVKYLHKTDVKHPNYKSIILTSSGIGANYTNTPQANYAKYRGENTKDNYINKSGRPAALPAYYRNKLYTEQQKEEFCYP